VLARIYSEEFCSQFSWIECGEVASVDPLNALAYVTDIYGNNR
jgi:hypothetical protein